ncbi:hypothetical protein RBSWK_02776 [Rhodopirellula baltica SWK14]|uniref:Uncharacterized protein n=1 Tax=Rhodopirellula baltica SWK14 TaxID=993516 RepID=L7CG95_RHOBT|nr:hypothetical protein RBSWK_02776 [Rhodopirellula baltica SWK14]
MRIRLRTETTRDTVTNPQQMNSMIRPSARKRFGINCGPRWPVSNRSTKLEFHVRGDANKDDQRDTEQQTSTQTQRGFLRTHDTASGLMDVLLRREPRRVNSLPLHLS